MKNIQIIILLLAIFITGNANGQLWKQFADSAKVYIAQKNTHRAIELYYKAREELKKDSAGTNSYAQICYALAFSLSQKNQYKEAEPLYLEAKQIKEKVLGKEQPDYALICAGLATVYRNMGQYEKAEALYIVAKQIQEKVLGKNHPDYGSSCAGLAALYRNLGLYTKAEPLYLEAKQIREKQLGKENPNYANSCNGLALLYEDMGQYEKAEPLFLESKQIWGKLFGKENPDYARTTNNLGGLYFKMGQYEKSELLFLEAKQIREKVLGKEHQDYAGSCNNLAILYRSIGQYEKAEPLLLEAKQIYEKLLGKEHPMYSDACINLGVVYADMGQFEKAEPLYLEAKQIQEKVLGKESSEYAGSCNNLAELYADMMGQFGKAEQLYLEAKQIWEKTLGKENPGYAESCDNLALLYEKMGQYSKALPLYKEALQIRQKVLGKLHPDYGLSCANLANLYWMQHQSLLAEKKFKESFSINAYNLNSLFEFTNEKEKTEYIKNILGEDDKEYSFYVSEKLESEQPYSLSLFHRNLILSSLQGLSKQLFYATDTTLKNKYNEWMNLKKYLSVLYSKPVDERKEDVAKMEEKTGQLEKELTRLSFTFKNEQQKQNITPQTIQQRLKADEAAIEFVEFQYYNGKRYTDSTFYIALVLRKDKPEPELVPLFEKRQLDALLKNKNTSASQHQLSFIYSGKKSASRTKTLYDVIWKPLEGKLTGIKTVYFAPAGLLHKISFAALPVNSAEVLSDKYRLVEFYTTASVTDTATDYIASSGKISIYGGIQYDADSASIKQAALKYTGNDIASRSLPEDLERYAIPEFPYLPGSEIEVDAISKLSRQNNYNVDFSEGLQATEESFKALTGRNSPAILHIATHGFFFPDPKNLKKDERSGGAIVFRQSDNPLMRSGLALAGANNEWKGKPIAGVEDGILTAYEISNMYMPNTKLVVLSACETGLGDIQGSEGVYGLQRAFKMTGVQNLVMSLWKVDDNATSEFMEEFYKYLFAKQTISAAFYHSQTVMKNKYRNDPYKWAAWVLIR